MACILFATACNHLGDEFVLKEYFDSEEHWDENGFQDYTDYCKYFYNENADVWFKNHSDYKEVKDENKKNIVSYFDNFKLWMETENRMEEYSFDTAMISEGDFFYLKTKEGEKIGNGVYKKFDNYSLYFYDVDSHTLVYIHNNI